MINCRIVQPMCETNLCFIRALPNGQNIPEFSRIVLFYRWQVISSKLKIDIRDGNAFYCFFFSAGRLESYHQSKNCVHSPLHRRLIHYKPQLSVRFTKDNNTSPRVRYFLPVKPT